MQSAIISAAFHVPWCRTESSRSASTGPRPKPEPEPEPEYEYEYEPEYEQEHEDEDEGEGAFEKRWEFDLVHSKLHGRWFNGRLISGAAGLDWPSSTCRKELERRNAPESRS